MFRKMRRFKQLLSFEESVDVLNRCTSGVLGVSGDNDYPYTVPISFVYEDNKIYFHCAKVGHKIDSITKNPKVSFCAIDEDKVVPEEYTTYFRSVIAFGEAKLLEDVIEKKKALTLLAEKYSPNQDGLTNEVEKELSHVSMVVIEIQHMTGKEAIELVRARP